MRLVPIPKDVYDEYRLRVMFDCYKWDPQFLDHNTISKYALVLSKEEYLEVKELTEALDKETRAAERYLNEQPKQIKPLRLKRKIRKELPHMSNYDAAKHIRLMRYDFHPTTEGGWAVSEVNSDVPGGYAESSLMPYAVREVLGDEKYFIPSFGERLVEVLCEKTPAGGRIMLVHCTSYSDDRQVMQFLGDQLEKRGYGVLYAAADHLKFTEKKAESLLDGNEGVIDAIVRFTPLEWLIDMKTKHWSGYFDTTTCSCNHPIAIYAQSKCFPFVWDTLEANGIPMTTWRSLLPDTVKVSAAKGKDGYIYKPVYGRVGENISIKESCTKEEYKMIMREVKLLPHTYIAQKRFESLPLDGENNEKYHVCLGSYVINEKHAGFYARISDTPRIDSNAADIPVLIEGMEEISTNILLYNEKDDVGKEVYRVWAPTGTKWTEWVRPVPFMQMNDLKKDYIVSTLDIPNTEFLEISNDMAVIVDLPGENSVEMGLALAKQGYRPIPVFNGVQEQANARATVDNETVTKALFKGADILSDIQIKEDALPAFLMDKNRLQRFKMDDSIFDNSWDIYPQDLPSGDYFKKQGIKQILVISKMISKDLKKLLFTYQKKGLAILHTDGHRPPKPIKVRQPLPFER